MNLFVTFRETNLIAKIFSEILLASLSLQKTDKRETKTVFNFHRRLTFLKEQLDLARKNPQLGQLEAQCPTLANFKTTYVQEVFGQQTCGYEVVTGIIDRSNDCNRLAQEKWSAEVDKIGNHPNKK